MATQYTAGLTQGQKLTAATMDQIGAAWETWTPTVTSTAGTITTGALTYARYGRINKLVFGAFKYVITTAGTAAGASLNFTLPITALAGYAPGDAIGSGRESGTTGDQLNCFATSTTAARLSTYANAGWIQNTTTATCFFMYEAV